MRRFVPRFQGKPWTDGLRVLHVYVLPDLAVDSALGQLVSACREEMTDYPTTLLDDAHLHATVEMVADTSADRIPQHEREALTEALHEHLADAPPFAVMAGSPIANKAGALLDLSPDAPLVNLKRRVQAAIQQTRGPKALQHNGGRHHISLGYAWGSADGDPLQSALRRISPSHAPLHVSGVYLLDVLFREHLQDDGPGFWEISWDYVASISLAGAHATGATGSWPNTVQRP